MKIRTFIGLVLSICLVMGLVVTQFISSQHKNFEQLSQLVSADSLVLAELEQLDNAIRQYAVTADLILAHGESYLIDSMRVQQESLAKLFTHIVDSPLIEETASIERMSLTVSEIQEHLYQWSNSVSNAIDHAERLNTLIADIDPLIAELVQVFSQVKNSAKDKALATAGNLDERRRSVRNATISAVVLYGTIILLMWYWSTRYVGRPLTDLSAAGRASLDNGASFIAQLRGPNEVAEVSRQLGTLIANLELKVDSRTQALSDQNRKLVAAMHAAEQASRAKSEFMARMSHEIRTPMNGVLGMAELLLTSDISDQQREYVLTILDSGDGLMSIINDVLDFSKIEAGKLELNVSRFNVHEAIAATATLVAQHADRKGLKVILPAPMNDQLWVYGDKLRFRQILTNLIGNAVKFTNEGQIEIGVAAKHNDENEVTLEVHVADTGLGIEAEDVKHVFDSFSQVDGSDARQFGGTGLGLPISKELVELMGGKIGVQSKVNQGSKFWFEITLEQAEAKPSKQYPTDYRERDSLANSDMPLPLSTRNVERLASAPKILIAEDNKANQKVAMTMLNLLGCEVDLAEDGQSALTKAMESGHDVILMDCQMPNMDGFTATQEIRKWEKQHNVIKTTPIIALTANALVTDRERCLAVGMTDYLSKPFKLAELKSAIEQALPDTFTTSEIEADSSMHPFITPELDELSQLGVSRSELEEIVSCYIESSNASIDAMAIAIESQNSESIRKLAHKLQGGSAQVGAHEVAKLCSQLRVDAENGSWKSMVALHLRIQHEADAFSKQLCTINNRLTA